MALQHLRSSTAHKRPIPTVMSAGQIAVNTNEASPGLFFKDSNGDLVKVGPVHIGTDAPNSSPASVDATALVTGTVYQILTVGTSDFTLVGASANTVGTIFTATGTTTGDGTVSGQQGVEKGEQWLDTTGGTYVLKIYDGSAWRSESGTFVDSAGDTMTGALLLDNAASASAPDLSFDGDANTGIYSPGADQLAVATNGTGRLFIDSSGRVGIGTSPSYLLDARTASGNAQIHLRSGGDLAQLFLISNDTTGVSQINFGDNDANNVGLITYDHSNNALKFTTNSSEAMRIASDGSVGIGTISPSSNLHVKGTDIIQYVESTNTAAEICFRNNTSTGDNIRIGGSGNNLTFDTGGSESARIDSSGRLGLGTTSPSSILNTSKDSSNTVHTGTNYPATESGILVDNLEGTTGTYAAVTMRASNGSTTQSGSILAKSTGSGFSPEIHFSQRTGSGTNQSRMIIDSSGNVGIGTSSPSRRLTVSDGGAGSAGGIGLQNSEGSFYLYTDGGKFFAYDDTVPAPRLTIDSSGNVGIGTTSPSGGQLVVNSTLDASNKQLVLRDATNGWARKIGVDSSNNMAFYDGDTEAARLDSSGRLLVGTSSHSGVNSKLEVADTIGGRINLRRVDSSISSDEGIGAINFIGDDPSAGAVGAQIAAAAESAWGASPGYPSRLVFSTTASGASSPTERMRISNQGSLMIGTTNELPASNSVGGAAFYRGQGLLQLCRGGDLFSVNRTSTDGTLVNFLQDGTTEGTISVSGTTVSYNGAHLARWSQLASGAARTEILRGSVLSNLDEMCEWGDEDNEQLNRMKVSDIEGDRNVSGVFQAWDDDDDTYTNDFYCAMTGDFVIRIAQGTTVARGDLLMSAGDGTAKPQDDDIIRSKTIAKVTSTVVSETYSDGSYCVPCVLMAC